MTEITKSPSAGQLYGHELSNSIDDATGVEDVGFGPVVKLETICKKCNSVTGGSGGGYHSCKICDALVSDVRYRSVRMFRTDVA